MSGKEIFDAVQDLRPIIREAAADSERSRRVAQPVIDALARAGAFHSMLPQHLGGSETDLPGAMRLFEEVSRGDGSAGWVTMIGAANGVIAAYLPEQTVRTVFGNGPGVVTAGVVAPRGKAVTEGNSYRVSGRWPFASGCEHSRWIALNCLVETDGKLETLPNGMPDQRLVVVPDSDVNVLDTWHTSGLRGTGSHDVEVSEAIVPREFTYSFLLDQPLQSGTLYRFPLIGLFAVSVASCALGIARGALDEIREMAPNRMPFGHIKPITEWEHAQAEFARAEGTLRAARTFLFNTVEEVWRAIEGGEEASGEQRALIRIAACEAVGGSVEAVDAAYKLGGGSALYEGNPLQRRFRDVHAITQHFLVAPATMEMAGAVLFGGEAPPFL